MPASASMSDLIDIQLLKKSWLAILVTGIGAAALAFTYVKVTPPAYEAEVRVVIQNKGLGVEGAGDKPTYDKEFLSTQAEIIRSPATISRSLQELPPHPADAVGENTDSVALISEMLRVNLLAGTDIVRLTFTHTNPEYAVSRLKSIIDSYQSHISSAEQVSASLTAELLQARETELAKQVNALQLELQNSRSKSMRFTSGTSANDSPMLKELTNRWVKVQADIAQIDSMLQSTRDAEHRIGILDDMNNREMQQLEKDLLEARSEAGAAKQSFGPVHPERIAAEQRVSLLEETIQLRQRDAHANLTRQSQQLHRENASLNQIISEESERLKQAGTAQIEEERLQAEIEQLADLHRSTAAALESVKLATRTLSEGRSSILIDVIDEFTTPQMPVWPKPAPLIAIAAMLGALLGLAVCVVNRAFRLHPTFLGTQREDDEQLRENQIEHATQQLSAEVEAYIEGETSQTQHAIDGNR